MEQFSFEPEKVTKTTHAIPTEKAKAELSLVKVYLWFALGLLITGAVSLALPYIMAAFVNDQNAELIADVYIGMMVASIILLLPAMIIIHIQSFRKNTPLILTSYIIYAIAMGVLLSVIFLDFLSSASGIQTLCIAFFVTGGVFLLCGLFGALTKKHDLKLVYPIVMSVILGVLVISLVNIFIGSSVVYWVTDFVLFGVIIIVAMLDNHQIHKFADSGCFENATNLAIYCAFTIYSDFIWIFIRLVYYISLFKGKN
jgi:uncharacterized protein